MIAGALFRVMAFCLAVCRLGPAADTVPCELSFTAGDQPTRWNGSFLGQNFSLVVPPGCSRLRIATAPGVPVRAAGHLATAITTGSGAIADWHNSGGNAARNGRSRETGPNEPTILWSGGRVSNIGWLPVIEGSRMFTVRLLSFPGCGTGGPVVASDLDTGEELWFRHLPCSGGGDWFPWVGGVKNGRVFASRAGSDATPFGRLYALDAVTGAILWQSDEDMDSGAYDGMVFAENGDPIIGGFQDLWRIDATDGSTVWNSVRVCSVSGSCGAAVFENAVYVVDVAPGFNHVIKRFDIQTGALMYQSPNMPGFTVQQSPMVSPDGTVYLARTQNNPSTDFFYSFKDGGVALTLNWSVPAGWATTAEFAIGPDDSVYMLAPAGEIHRLDPDSGEMINASAPIPAEFPGPRMAVDLQGKLFVGQRGNGNGRLYSFDADLAPRWDLLAGNINIGGPSLGQDGTLIICNSGTDVRAFRCGCQLYGDIAPQPAGDCTVDLFDILCVLDGFSNSSLCPVSDVYPCNGGDSSIDLNDIFAVLDAFAGSFGCPHPCAP